MKMPWNLRIKLFLFFFTLINCFFSAGAAFSSGSGSGMSIVPEREAIADLQAMTMLAEILIRQGGADNLSRAEEILKIVRGAEPGNARAHLAQIHLDAVQGNRFRVTQLTDEFVRTREFDAEVFMEIADISASLGHFARCRDIYLLVLSRLEGSQKQSVRLKFAERTFLWGDFYTSEIIVREALALDAGNRDLMLALARNLIAQQRFVQAGKYLGDAVRSSARESETGVEARILKILTGLLEKDHAAAASDTDAFISLYGVRDRILIPGARAYYEAGRDEDSEALFQAALQQDEMKNDALIGLALIRIRQGDDDGASGYLAAVDEDSRSYPLTMVLSYRHNEPALSRYIEEFVLQQSNPAKLLDLAEALAGRGHHDRAVMCYEAALDLDHEFFPAFMGLAEMLGASGEYGRSLEVLQSMMDIFPESYKIRLSRARVLAWSRQYQDALAAYEEIYLDNPANAVILTESARTAYWGKMADTGHDLYGKIFDPTVDAVLLERLLDLSGSAAGNVPVEPLQKLKAQVDQDSVFEGYEDFFSWFRQNIPDLDTKNVQSIQEIKYELDHVHVMHKRAFLEQQSKNLAWNRRFAPARRSLNQLTAIHPGNQEALFDLAQASCSLGLCDEEKEVYEALLGLDPLHGQAGRALERQRVRSRPLIFGGYSFWSEKGRGELARMTRQRFDLGLEIPVFCRHSLKLTAHKYLESPQKYGDAVSASGMSLEGAIVTGPYLTFFGRITRKAYDQDLKVRNFSELAGRPVADDSFRTGLKDITMGSLGMRANLDNYGALTLGYEKREELANAMALAQGIHSDRFKARLDLYPARKLDMALEAEYMDYSDDNSGYIYGGEIGYAFTDHPRTFKAIFSAGYRDTSREYQACPGSKAQCSIRDDFRHPYWTPQDYWEAAVTFEFRHDLAKDFFCGAREHFYDLKLTLGTEQDSNNSVELRGLWQREFSDRLGFRAQAMWHYSREWKAQAVDLGIFFRF